MRISAFTKKQVGTRLDKNQGDKVKYTLSWEQTWWTKNKKILKICFYIYITEKERLIISRKRREDFGLEIYILSEKSMVLLELSIPSCEMIESISSSYKLRFFLTAAIFYSKHLNVFWIIFEMWRIIILNSFDVC